MLTVDDDVDLFNLTTYKVNKWKSKKAKAGLARWLW